MAEARTRLLRLRGWTAGVLAVAYVLAVVSFWVVGASAFMRSTHGSERLLGIAYLPILVLPVIGHGVLDGIRIHSWIWIWWFLAQIVLGVATVWAYPHEGRWRRVRGGSGPHLPLEPTLPSAPHG